MKSQPKCYGKPMTPGFPSRAWAKWRKDEDTEIEIESSLWHCPSCQSRKAQPEKWRKRAA